MAVSSSMAGTASITNPPPPRFYIASAEPAGAITACACGSFLQHDRRTLAVARKDQLDIMGFDREGLKTLATARLADAIVSIHLVKPSWTENDLLFVLLSNREVHLLEFSLDYSGRPCISARASGSAADKVGKVSEFGPFVSIDPEHRCIALHIYESLVRLIPLNREPNEPRELETFNVRIDENSVKSMAFLHNAELPCLAILHSDSQGTHVATYDVDVREKDLKKPTRPSVELKNIEQEAIALMAIPGTNRGLLACGIEILTYIDADSAAALTVHIRKDNRGIGCVYTILSDTKETTKILVCDMRGYLNIIQLKKAPVSGSISKVVDVAMVNLGRLVIASCAAYLDNRVVFIGSRTCDSQIIRLREDFNPDTGCLFDVLESITNIGCVGDFALVRPDQGSQPQMVVCAGYGPGSVGRIIRSGIGLQEITSLEIPTARQIFAFQSTAVGENSHDMLMLSFVNETRILKIGEEIGDFEDMPPESVGAFLLNEPTFLLTTVGENLCQVTKSGIRMIEPGSLSLKAQWTPSHPGSYQIGCAASYDNLIVAGGYDTLLIVDVSGEQATMREISIEGQISAVDIRRFGEKFYIAIATWRMDVILLSSPDWQMVSRVDLNSTVFARSILLKTLDGVDYVLCGLGDGGLQYFVFDRTKEILTASKRLNIGTQPTTLQPFIARGMESVFVCNDRANVLHSSGGKLVFSNVNMKQVYAVAQLNSASYADSLVIVTDDGFVIGRMDEIQKLHTRCVKLPGSPRRIAYQPESSSFAFITIDEPGAAPVGTVDSNAGGDAPSHSQSQMDQEMDEEDSRTLNELPQFKLVISDHLTYHVLATYSFNRLEAVSTVASGRLGKDPRVFYIVGTGLMKAEEKEATSGRLIIFHYNDKQLTIVTEKQMKGMIYQLEIFRGKVLMCCGQSLRLMSWNEEGELVPEHHLARFIMPQSLRIKGDFVLVADLLRSLHVLAYRSDENKFEVIGDDPYPAWPNTCEFVDDDVYLMATGSGNIIFLRREAEATSGSVRELTEIAGINVADSVNVVRKGTLLPDSQVLERPAAQNSLILATVSGGIMVVLQIEENIYQILRQVSERLCRTLMPFGRVTPDKYNAILDDNGSFKKPAFGVINGDLIELVSAMNNEEMRELIAGVNDANGLPLSVEALSRMVEDLSRSH